MSAGATSSASSEARAFVARSSNSSRRLSSVNSPNLRTRVRTDWSQTRRRVAVGAENARRRWDDDRPRTGQATEGVGVQWSRATEGDEREVTRVEALLHRDQTQGAEHVLVDDVDDPRRSVLD